MIDHNEVTKNYENREAICEQIKELLDQKRRALNEVTLMSKQSQIELGKLAQRNASISAQIQQLQTRFDTLPSSEVRAVFELALEAQQKLLVMRGQMEKLQSEQAHLQDFVEVIEQIHQEVERRESGRFSSSGSNSTARTLEMLIQAQENERRRLSRQMHDGPAQALSNFILQAEIALRFFDIDQLKAREELESLKTAANDAFQKVRDFIFELRPMMLDDLGLIPTLKRYIEILGDGSKPEIKLIIYGKEKRMEPFQEVMIFRAIQELLFNSIRRGRATSIKVQLALEESEIRALIEDDGEGFDVGAAVEGEEMGLKVIQERIETMGGSMEIDSQVERGTRVQLTLPLSGRSVIV